MGAVSHGPAPEGLGMELCCWDGGRVDWEHRQPQLMEDLFRHEVPPVLGNNHLHWLALAAELLVDMFQLRPLTDVLLRWPVAAGDNVEVLCRGLSPYHDRPGVPRMLCCLQNLHKWKHGPEQLHLLVEVHAGVCQQDVAGPQCIVGRNVVVVQHVLASVDVAQLCQLVADGDLVGVAEALFRVHRAEAGGGEEVDSMQATGVPLGELRVVQHC
eukprot:CAMPEP_0117675796 /NCGR_PEP_ID=MMETSP0804-20121206/15809_1 /TAXON_ID=1074897 /ORGANISM="Tetraselmis astigmatica, Strain CCMP880" /LENGTH=212 /DNA_ID=CAMNT_0005484849 /DNA_START=413 /DNA_END=1051 /DNA_ORIENTATION=-